MLDLAVRNGRAVTPYGVLPLDIGVAEGRIVALTRPGALPGPAREEVDAKGRPVTPGGVEPHAHVAVRVPREWCGREDLFTQSVEGATRAALFGGTTTLVDFFFVRPDREILSALSARRTRWEGRSYVDYAFHCILPGPTPTRILEQIPEAVEEGVASFKVFLAEPTGRPGPTVVDAGSLERILRWSARAGAMVVVHAEEPEMVADALRRLREEGDLSLPRMPEVHSKASEDLAFRKVIRLAEREGAGVCFLHTTAREGVEAVAEARARGLPVYAEVLHHFLCFTEEVYRLPDGGKYHTYPSLHGPEDRDALWWGLVEGVLSLVGTDEYTTPLEVKTWGRTVETVCGGHAGVETRLPILFSEGVQKGRLTLERFVEVTGTAPARVLGLYPRKGVIAVGSDADLVVWDPSVRRRLRLEDLHHEGDYSIWEGWEVHGWPAVVIRRGRVAVREGRLEVGPEGEWLPRRVEPLVLRRPVC